MSLFSVPSITMIGTMKILLFGTYFGTTIKLHIYIIRWINYYKMMLFHSVKFGTY